MDISVGATPSRAPRRAPRTQVTPLANARRGPNEDEEAASMRKEAGTCGRGFRRAEVASLLDSIKEILPVGPMEWKIVLHNHNLRLLQCNWLVTGIRRNFANLYNTLPPTGDSNVDPHVLRAKNLHQKITENSDCGDDSVGNLGFGEILFEEEEGEHEGKRAMRLNEDRLQNNTADAERSTRASRSSLLPRPLITKLLKKKDEGKPDISEKSEKSAVKFRRLKRKSDLKENKKEEKEKIVIDKNAMIEKIASIKRLYSLFLLFTGVR